MKTVSAPDADSSVPDLAPAVAVVARDEAVRQRALSALIRDGQVISVQTASSDQLEPESTRHTEAVVIACRGRADERTAAIGLARSRLPEARVIIIATADVNGVHKALEAGADGFVFEADLEATLPSTVRAVRAGQLVVPPTRRAEAVRPPLSHREKQALSLLVLGLTNAEIARRLYLAESTVKCHLTSIFSKLGVRSRNEAVAHVVDSRYALDLDVPRP
jgi:DNA-binding NarL/FixJ family response regulator